MIDTSKLPKPSPAERAALDDYAALRARALAKFVAENPDYEPIEETCLDSDEPTFIRGLKLTP